MQIVVGIAALSVAVVTPLWAARAVLVGIVGMLATGRRHTTANEPSVQPVPASTLRTTPVSDPA